MIIHLNTSKSSYLEFELCKNSSVKIHTDGAHTDNGAWSKEDNVLELDIPNHVLVKALIDQSEEDVSTEGTLIFTLKE